MIYLGGKVVTPSPIVVIKFSRTQEELYCKGETHISSAVTDGTDGMKDRHWDILLLLYKDCYFLAEKFVKAKVMCKKYSSLFKLK